MIFLVLFIALILRLINLNQSLWLDEAVQAITAKGPFWGIFEELWGDFHPPLYHILMWGWVRIFGASEVSLRLPSVLFGVGCIFVMYKIAMHVHHEIITAGRKDGIGAVLVAVFLATAPFHIYYSQEARMYSLGTFLAALSMYYFGKILNLKSQNSKLHLKSKIFYFISTLCLVYSDYYGFLILLAQMIFLMTKKQFRFIVLSSSFIILSYFLWLPFLITQFKTGLTATSDLPGWGNLVNINFFKALPLTFVKFAIGRITIFDRRLYASMAVIIFGIYGWIGGYNSYKSYKNNKYYKLILFWFLIPILGAWLGSLVVPNYQPFRLLLVLPAFYLLLAMGISSLQSNKVAVFLSFFVVLVNLTSLFVYYKNPYFWREDWRGVASLVRTNDVPIIISAQAFNWPLVYYGVDDKVINVAPGAKPVELSDIPSLLKKAADKNEIFYTPYLADLYDPKKLVPTWFEKDGFVKIKEISFNQIPLWIYKK